MKAVVEYGKQLFPGLDLRTRIAQGLIDEGYESYFDIVVCSEVIEHIADNEKVAFLNGLKKLLKEDGFLILTIPRKDAEAEWKNMATLNNLLKTGYLRKLLQSYWTRQGFRHFF